MPIFDQVHPKNQFIPSINYWDTANFRVSRTNPFLTYIPKKSTLNFPEFVPKCKKSSYLIILFWKYSWFKNSAISLAKSILAHTSGTNFFQIWVLCRTTAHNIIYTSILEQIQKNINGQIFQYIQKTILSSFFSTYFVGQKKFLKKIWLCHIQLHMSF